jgi:hypothetical protein
MLRDGHQIRDNDMVGLITPISNKEKPGREVNSFKGKLHSRVNSAYDVRWIEGLDIPWLPQSPTPVV